MTAVYRYNGSSSTGQRLFELYATQSPKKFSIQTSDLVDIVFTTGRNGTIERYLYLYFRLGFSLRLKQTA